MFELPNLDELETNLSMARAHAAGQRRFVGQPEELLEAWFDREHPTFVRKRRTYEARFKHLSDISQRLRNKRSLWNFFVVDRRLRQVGSLLVRVQENSDQLRDRRAHDFNAFAAKREHIASVHIAESKLIASFISGMDDLIHKLREVRAKIERQVSVHGEARLGIRWRPNRLSELPPYALDVFEGEVDEVHGFTQDILPTRVSQAALASEASDILRETIKASNDTAVDGIQFAEFVKATTGTLRAALRRHTSSASGEADLDTVLQDAIAPANFRTAAAWIVFWTALAACNRYHAKMYASLASEDISSDTWCGEWERRISQWKRDICRAFGMADDSIHVIRGNYQSVAAETHTGADILLALSIRNGGKTRVRLAFVQFKRSTGNERTIDVWRDGTRQFDNLARMHNPRSGSSSMHALLSRQYSGLAAVSAVDTPRSLAAINSALKIPLSSGTASWTAADCKVDWQEHGQSFCTLLMENLCNDEHGSFTTAQAAFDWMGTLTAQDPNRVPRYMLFQAVGEDAYAHAYALKHEAERWVKTLGLRREDHGPSLGR